MDDPSNMNKNQSSMIVLFFLALAVLLALLYLDFYLYGTKKLLSERITITESLLVVGLGAFVVRKQLRGAFRPKIIALSVTFGVLLYAAQWAIAYVPAFVWYTPPISYFATAILVYLPQGLIVSALIVLTDFTPGSIFLMIVPFYVISMIAFFNPIWTPFYFAMASMAEVFLTVGRDGKLSAILSSSAFSLADAAFASQFMLFNFGVYQPPQVQLLSALVDVVFSVIGAALGIGVGMKAKQAWRP